MSYADRLEAFRKSDSERDAMVTEILRNYEELHMKYVEKVDDYNNEVESRRMWQSKARTTELALSEQKQASGSSNFALAVIDGDGAIFQDYLLAMGKDGGADAAQQLHTELRNHLRTVYPDSNVSDWSIVVQIVLNLQGLGTKLHGCGIINNPQELVSFGRAFSHAQPLFSFIDVGGGKERADHKIRETLRLFLPNAQCKHVFFGPCHDNGYLPVLEPYRLDPATSSRLTLIETTPATPGFMQLGLPRIRCSPRLFRSDNLPASAPAKFNGTPSPFQPPMPVRTNTVPVPAPVNASSIPFIPQSPSPAPSENSTASSTWATVGKTGATSKNINIASKKAPAKKYILLNVHDERVDAPLPPEDPKASSRFHDMIKAYGNYCNHYHLTGKCKAGEYCDYHHGEVLTPGEKLVLKHKARSLSCPGKYMCRNMECFLGHHCKFGNGCTKDNCRFWETHGMDVVSWICWFVWNGC